MPKSSTSAVDHDTDLAFLLNAHLSCIELVIDLVDYLNLSVMIPSTQRSELQTTKY